MMHSLLSSLRLRRSPRRRKYAVTLIEMIIVMILIATITGALALNYQKSLDRGRTFATQQRIERLHAILTMYFSQHPEQISINQNWPEIIDNSGLGPPNPNDLLKDDWGNAITVNVSTNDGTLAVVITSPMAAKKNIDKKS
jgi:type II secretory pathway pseudopilin PulG